jgi:uncharacterized protein RhaS with RHS repeats
MIARFVSEDPLGLAGGINPYVYANNDPVNGSDPSGMDEALSCIDWYDVEYVNGVKKSETFLFTQCYATGGGGGGGDGNGGSKAYKSCKVPLLVPLPSGIDVTSKTSSVRMYFAPPFAAALGAAISIMNSRGVVPKITQGFRTYSDQVAMRNGGSGTNPAASPGNSLHESGYAVDFRITGQEQLSIMRSATEANGISWGGSFITDKPDPNHFYMNPFSTLAARQAANIAAAAYYHQCTQ